MARGSGIHCQDLSEMPPKQWVVGRKDRGVGRSLRWVLRGPSYPCNLMLVGGNLTWPLIWFSLDFCGVYSFHSLCPLHVPYICLSGSALTTYRLCAVAEMVMQCVAGQDLASDGSVWWELSQRGWRGQWYWPLGVLVCCVHFTGRQKNWLCEINWPWIEEPSLNDSRVFPKSPLQCAECEIHYLFFETMRWCTCADIMNGTMMDRCRLKAGVIGSKMSISWLPGRLSSGTWNSFFVFVSPFKRSHLCWWVGLSGSGVQSRAPLTKFSEQSVKTIGEEFCSPSTEVSWPGPCKMDWQKAD